MDRATVELTATALACGIPAMQIVETILGRFIHETVPALPAAATPDDFRMLIATATCADDPMDDDAEPIAPAA